MARNRSTNGKIGEKSSPAGMPDLVRTYAMETKPEDIAWVGGEPFVGDADRERDEAFDATKRAIFNPRYALRRILTEIIRHHPVEHPKRSDEARLEDALTALLGPVPSPTDKHPGGRKELADDELLRVIAREHLGDVYKFSEKPRTVTELCYVAMEEVIPSFKKLKAGELETIRHRLAGKFAAGEARDRIMIEYTGRTDYDARRYIDLTNKVLPYLSALGLIAEMKPRTKL
jgi:hypothetical protein